MLESYNKGIFKILNAWPLLFGPPRVINYRIIEIVETLQFWKKKNLSSLCPPVPVATCLDFGRPSIQSSYC